MEVIAARARGNVDGTRGGKFVRKVQSGLAKLKLLDGAGGNVSSCGTDGLVADVHTVHFNASCATVSPAERNGGVACLRKVTILSILNLHSALKLCDVKQVAPVDRQALELPEHRH